MRTNKETTIKDVGTAIGVGIIAGLAGTLAITLSRAAERRITGRKSNDTAEKAAREVLDIKPVTPGKSEKVSQEVHLGYGTSLGLIRGILSLAGMRGIAATAIHFVTVWGNALVMLPLLRVTAPVTKEKVKSIAIDAFHHLVYAATAGLVFDAINCLGNKEESENQQETPEDKFARFRRDSSAGHTAG